MTEGCSCCSPPSCARAASGPPARCESSVCCRHSKYRHSKYRQSRHGLYHLLTILGSSACCSSARTRRSCRPRSWDSSTRCESMPRSSASPYLLWLHLLWRRSSASPHLLTVAIHYYGRRQTRRSITPLQMAAASASLWRQMRGALRGRGARRQGQGESRVAALQRHRLRAHRRTARAHAERLDCPRGPRPRSFRRRKWTALLERHARPAPEYLGL